MMIRFLKGVMSIILVVLAVRLLDFSTIFATIRHGNAITLLVVVGINLVTFIILGIRWYWMISPRVPLPFLSHLAIYMKATFLNTFTPANLGGDVYRITALKNEQTSTLKLLTLLVRERLLGLYGYLLVFIFSWIWLPSAEKFDITKPFSWGAIFALIAFIALFFVLPFSRFTKKICGYVLPANGFSKAGKWIDVATTLLSTKGTLKLMVVSLLATLTWLISIKVMATSFGLSISLLQLASVATMVEIVRLIPLTIQGIGVREGVFAYMLSLLGHDSSQCYALGVVAYIALSISIVLCGPLGKLLSARFPTKPHI